MTRVYEEIVNFIASGTSPNDVASFSASPEIRDRVSDLLHREKTTGLSPDEQSELGHYLELEHLMRLAKARARRHIRDE